MKFFPMFPSNQNPGAAHVYRLYTVYLSVVTCPPFPIFIRGGPHVLGRDVPSMQKGQASSSQCET